VIFWRTTGPPHRVQPYFPDLAAFFAGDGGSAGLTWSPSTRVNGQTLKAGHLAHPATTAMGQSVMVGA